MRCGDSIFNICDIYLAALMIHCWRFSHFCFI